MDDHAPVALPCRLPRRSVILTLTDAVDVMGTPARNP
jgi:hypothetical protein